MARGLSGREVRAFAEMFGDLMSAGPLLVSVDLPRRSQPAWHGLSAEEFWWEVSRLLAAGAVRDGRRRLLEAAREQFPSNEVFAAGGDDGPAGPSVWNVPPPVVGFVGRQEQLSELANKLTAGAAVSVVALAGMGGVGKTALAVEYAYRHEDEFDVVWWVPAERADLIAGRLAELGEALELPTGAEPAAVFAELRRRGRPWLLIFDNVEDPAAVAPLRPTDRWGRLLVTSRRAGWGGPRATVQVPTLPRAESVALLSDRLAGVDPVVADGVADLLGDLALALEQAAGFCAQTGTPLAELASWLVERLEDVIALGGVADRAGETVATLWDLSIERLSVTAPAAVELLELLALFAPEPVPLDLFEGRAELLGGGLLAEAAGDRLAWARLVGALVGYSLASRDTAAVWVHRLVAAATRRKLGEVRRAELVAVLVGLLRADLPENITRAPEGWPRWWALLAHARTVLDSADDPTGLAAPCQADPPATAGDLSWLCDRTATFLQEQAQPAEALPLFQRALAIGEAAYGPDHPVVATRLNNLASVLQDLGRVGEAVPLFQRALAIDEAVYGPDHPVVARALSYLALALRGLGRAGEAVPLFQRALAIDEAVYGPDHPVVASVLNNLASALHDLGRAGEAVPLFQRALAIDEAVYGPDHPEVATDLNNLALTLQDLGRAGEAVPLFQRALAIGQAVYGPDHPVVATRLNNLALPLQALGRVGEAAPLFQRALAIDEAVYGPDHPDVATVLNNLASALQDLGRVGEAVPLFQRALAIGQAVYGPDHPDIATRLNNLALALRTLGRAGEAVPLFQRALAIGEAVYGPDHPVVASVLNNLASALQDLGRVGEAVPLFQRALAIGQAVYGPDHPDIATRLNNLALALRTLGRVGDAVPLFQRALAIGEAVYGPDHPNCRTTRGNLAACEALVTDGSES
ncbi:tetratricopeptide repeat protein [Pseudofrankia saprophytica]|nr:tetratricopeptide repeat protein [Pseudofrankia saprophytica]